MIEVPLNDSPLGGNDALPTSPRVRRLNHQRNINDKGGNLYTGEAVGSFVHKQQHSDAKIRTVHNYEFRQKKTRLPRPINYLDLQSYNTHLCNHCCGFIQEKFSSPASMQTLIKSRGEETKDT
jgi:hypothetical protein